MDEDTPEQVEQWTDIVSRDKFKDFLLKWIIQNIGHKEAANPVPSSSKTHDFGYHNGDGFLQICGEARSAGSHFDDEWTKVLMGVVRCLSKYNLSIGIVYNKKSIDIYECYLSGTREIKVMKEEVDLPRESGQSGASYGEAALKLIDHFVHKFLRLAAENPARAEFKGLPAENPSADVKSNIRIGAKPWIAGLYVGYNALVTRNCLADYHQAVFLPAHLDRKRKAADSRDASQSGSPDSKIMKGHCR